VPCCSSHAIAGAAFRQGLSDELLSIAKRVNPHYVPADCGTNQRINAVALRFPSSRKKWAGRTNPETVALILQLRNTPTAARHDAGGETIAWHLGQHHQIQISTAQSNSRAAL